MFGRRFDPTKRKRSTNRREERNDFKLNEQERDVRYRQLLSSNFNPQYTLGSDVGKAKFKLPSAVKTFVSEEVYNRKAAANFQHQLESEKIDLKAKGVNPITVNLPAQVFPYGGGVAPHRQLTKQELVTYYLGSRAIAKITLLDQYEKGSSLYGREDRQEARNRLIKGDNIQGYNQPLIPYPLFNPDTNDGMNTGSIEDAVFYNRRWWNKNTPGLKFRPVLETQEELTDEQVNAVWDKVSPEIYQKVGRSLLEQDIGRERDVPQIGNNPPLVPRPSDGKLVKAVHGFDIDGTMNSARNQELTTLVGKELTVAEKQRDDGDTSPELQERIKLLSDSADILAEERIAPAKWDMKLSDKRDEITGERKTLDEIKQDEQVSTDVFCFWGGPMEHRDLYTKEELDDCKISWHNNNQIRAANIGMWESNYLYPEFEPGMFASPKNIEYRTYGVTDLYTSKLQRVLDDDTSKGEIEQLYVTGKIDPVSFRPKDGKEREEFDRKVIKATLNTTTSDKFKEQLDAYNDGILGEGKDPDKKASALLIFSPNANKKRLEELFAEDPFAPSNFKTSRHEFARNLARNSDEEIELEYAVQPINSTVLDDADARSIEEDLRDTKLGKRIWSEYARVKGDVKGGYTIRQ